MTQSVPDPLGGLLGAPVLGTTHRPATGASAERQTKPFRGRVPGEIGIWVFIFGDMMAFGLMFIVFLSARMDEPEVFESSRRTLHLAFGAANTLLLLAGSLLVVCGIRALRTRDRRAPLLFALCWCCGLCFAVNKFIEYSMVIGAGHQLSDNLFYGYYFILTGVHLLHLAVAMIGMAVVWRISRRPAHSAKDLRNVEALGAYWHLVDLLWVILFPLIYLMRT